MYKSARESSLNNEQSFRQSDQSDPRLQLTGARVVSEPDAEVLDGGWLLLVDLLAGDNLANSLLDLLQTIQVVPEAGLGHNTISRENAHP